MILNLILLILLFNYSFTLINSSNSLKIEVKSKYKREEVVPDDSIAEEPEDLTEMAIDSTKEHAARVSKFTTNTLMIDLGFQSHWHNLMTNLENLMPTTRQGRFKTFPFVDPQIRLISGIRNNDPITVKMAIEEGARFLTIKWETNRIRSTNYYLIEYAVVEGKTRALKVMLDYMITLPRNMMNTFLGGLLIKAVQAGKMASIRVLVRNYAAPYLENSYLLQKAVMHQAPIEVIEFLMKTFKTIPELFKLHGRSLDTLLHLSIKFNNFDAFSYFYYHPEIDKNIMNANSLAAIDLLASLPFKSSFFEKLMKSHANILTSWTDEYGNNLLHLAVHYNNLNFVKQLVEETNFPVDLKNHDGKTALLISFFADKRETAIYLIEKGADVFHKDDHNSNVLMYAAEKHSFGFFRSCLEITNNRNGDALQELYQRLKQEEITKALNILLEIFPELNKEVNL